MAFGQQPPASSKRPRAGTQPQAACLDCQHRRKLRTASWTARPRVLPSRVVSTRPAGRSCPTNSFVEMACKGRRLVKSSHQWRSIGWAPNVMKSAVFVVRKDPVRRQLISWPRRRCCGRGWAAPYILGDRKECEPALPVTLLACQGRQSLSAPRWRLHGALGLNKSTNRGLGGRGWSAVESVKMEIPSARFVSLVAA